MINIQQERLFIQEVDRKTREMELEKAKLEQNKAMIEEQLRQIVDRMAQLGCTPDTIEDKITEYEDKIKALKLKMQSKLQPSVETNEMPF